jgi:hypothetical protein
MSALIVVLLLFAPFAVLGALVTLLNVQIGNDRAGSGDEPSCRSEAGCGFAARSSRILQPITVRYVILCPIGRFAFTFSRSLLKLL